MPTRPPLQPLRALPVPVPLVHGEQGGSLLRRLAIANHIHPTELRAAIGAGTCRHVPLEPLAALAGHPLELLVRILGDNPRHHFDAQRAACTRCLARVGITEDVAVVRPMEQPLCRRHHRWLPEHPYDPHRLDQDQADLLRLPEILSAQRRHARLVHRHGHTKEFFEASASAHHIVARWAERDSYAGQRRRRLSHYIDLSEWRVDAHHPLAIMARYPDVVALTGLLADRTWTDPALSHDPRDIDRVHAVVRHRLKIPYEPYTAHDPLVRWRFTEEANQRADPRVQDIRALMS